MAQVKKRCRRCNKRKSTKTQFYPDKQSKDGRRSYCKPCGKVLAAKPKTNSK